MSQLGKRLWHSGFNCTYHFAAPGSNPKHIIYILNWFSFWTDTFIECRRRKSKTFLKIDTQFIWLFVRRKLRFPEPKRHKNSNKSCHKIDIWAIFKNVCLKLKITCGYFLGNFWKNWITFYSDIWSHCPSRPKFPLLRTNWIQQKSFFEMATFESRNGIQEKTI